MRGSEGRPKTSHTNVALLQISGLGLDDWTVGGASLTASELGDEIGSSRPRVSLHEPFAMDIGLRTPARGYLKLKYSYGIGIAALLSEGFRRDSNASPRRGSRELSPRTIYTEINAIAVPLSWQQSRPLHAYG